MIAALGVATTSLYVGGRRRRTEIVLQCRSFLLLLFDGGAKRGKLRRSPRIRVVFGKKKKNDDHIVHDHSYNANKYTHI